MNRDEFIKKLEFWGIGDGYPEFLDWVLATPGTPKELYEQCPDVDWLNLLIEASGVDVDENKLTLQAAPVFAELELKIGPAKDKWFKQSEGPYVEYDRQIRALLDVAPEIGVSEQQIEAYWAKYDESYRTIEDQLEQRLAPFRTELNEQTFAHNVESEQRYREVIRSVTPWESVEKAMLEE